MERASFKTENIHNQQKSEQQKSVNRKATYDTE
jgi:hypothetical protein